MNTTSPHPTVGPSDGPANGANPLSDEERRMAASRHLRTLRDQTSLAAAADKAQVLVDALPWLERFRGALIVVKYGGNAMVDERLKRAFAQDIAFLRYAGLRLSLIHI